MKVPLMARGTAVEGTDCCWRGDRPDKHGTGNCKRQGTTSNNDVCVRRADLWSRGAGIGCGYQVALWPEPGWRASP